MSEHRDHSDLKRSFQVWLGSTVTCPEGTFPVIHDYALADPDLAEGGAGAGDEWQSEADGAREAQAWVEVRWLEELAGAGGWSSAQVDVFSRVGDPTADAGDKDPLGVRCEHLATAVQARFTERRAGLPGWAVDVLDFADVDSPQATGQKLMVQSRSRGTFGAPEERRRHHMTDGLQRVTLTFTIRLPQDALGAVGFIP